MDRRFVGYIDGVPCEHPGCLSHVTHPCEECGRIGGDRTATFWHIIESKDAKVKALKEESEKRKVAIWLLLDHVDYTEGACRLNEPVGGTLPLEIIKKAKEALS